MKILGLDPGSNASAFVIWDTELEEILTHGIPNNYLLERLFEEERLVNQGDVVVIEMFQNFGTKANAGASIFYSCIFIGKVLKICERLKVKTLLIPRKTIVSHHTKTVTGSDSTVRKVMLQKFPKGTAKKPGVSYGLKEDEWQALAALSYYLEVLSVKEI